RSSPAKRRRSPSSRNASSSTASAGQAGGSSRRHTSASNAGTAPTSCASVSVCSPASIAAPSTPTRAPPPISSLPCAPSIAPLRPCPATLASSYCFRRCYYSSRPSRAESAFELTLQAVEGGLVDALHGVDHGVVRVDVPGDE